MSLHHSVRLDEQLFRGCTNCLKTCPTAAIRVKNGKACIIEERCIDCGACIKRCPFRAKNAYSDILAVINGYDFTIALPAPALYGQFPRGISADNVLEGLFSLGFDECVEVAYAAEDVSRATRAYRDVHSDEGPLISSSCAAKVTATRDPLGDPDSSVDGVIGFNEIWLPLQETVSRIVKEANGGIFSPPRFEAGFRGASWARAEGEAEGAGLGETLAADGIGAVVEVLEALEDDRLEDIVRGYARETDCVFRLRDRIRNLTEEMLKLEDIVSPGMDKK